MTVTRGYTEEADKLLDYLVRFSMSEWLYATECVVRKMGSSMHYNISIFEASSSLYISSVYTRTVRFSRLIGHYRIAMIRTSVYTPRFSILLIELSIHTQYH